MKNILKRVLALVLAVALNISIVDVQVFAEINADTENDEAVIQTEEKSNVWDGVTTEDIYEGENYRVAFTVVSHWDAGYNANVKIENLGEEIIQNWYLNFDFGNDITNIWNAEIAERIDNKFVIKNVGWNQDIAVGSSVEFGISGDQAFQGFPQNYEMMGSEIAVSEEDFSIEYHVEEDWESGFYGSLSVTNNTDRALEDWRLEFDFDREITELWDGVIDSHEVNHYVVRNAEYNSTIEPGATVVIGIKGEGGTVEDEPSEFYLYSHQSGKNKVYREVIFNVGAENVTNMPETQSVEAGTYAVRPESPLSEDSLFMGWYTDNEFTDYFDFENETVDEDIVLYAKWFDYLDETDTDGDGVADSLEEVLGTNPKDTDTDGDKLNDYVELNLFGTDPVLPDTDRNGINDGEEDFDEDGLSNTNEMTFGTKPLDADSDEDKLNDYDEIHKYGTDPNKADTDGDGVSDGKEVEIGTDPLVAQESFAICQKSDYNGLVKAFVSMELKGNQVETLNVEPYQNDMFFSTDMPGYIGEAYDFSVAGNFEIATICFEFDEELLKSEDFDPVIYYYNEAEQQLEALETTVEGNIASTEVHHFSKYILLNRSISEKSYEWVDEWRTGSSYEGMEIVLVVDDSGSMTTNDKYGKRLQVARDLIDDLPMNSQMGIVKFTNSTTLLTSTLIEDKASAKKYLTADYFKSNGGTSMYAAINEGFSLLDTKSENKLKVMLVLSDGNTTDRRLHASTVSYAKENGIKIYTVGLGYSTSYFNQYLKPLAENTSGKFYLAKNASQLEDIYKEIGNRIDLEMDSDGDGLPDYFEENLPLFDGTRIKTDKEDEDSDDDGLLDGQEVKIRYIASADKTKVRVEGMVYSNPNLIDSDGDGLYDGKARMVGERIVAPKDPDPMGLKTPNVPAGMWERHVLEQVNGRVATEYGLDFGMKLPELRDALADEIKAYCDANNIDIPCNQEIANAIVELIIQAREAIKDKEELVQIGAAMIRRYSDGPAATIAGAYLLNFIYDNKLIAYHSQVETWQKYLGYNDLYDDVFGMAARMHNATFPFIVGEDEYILWAWKGDYWNMHSGAEIGLYVRTEIETETTKHYRVVDFNVPMTLSLYNYNSETNIDNIFNWAPEEKQWWITGFSGLNSLYLNANPNVMVVVGTIDLKEQPELFESLKNADKKYSDDFLKSKYKKYLMFDEEESTVWVIWYEGINTEVN